MMSLEFLRHPKSSQTSQENFSLWNKPVTNTDARFTSGVCSIVLTRLSRCNLVKSKPISTGLNPVYAACDNYFHIWLQLLIPCFSPCETSPRESLGNAGNYKQPPKEKRWDSPWPKWYSNTWEARENVTLFFQIHLKFSGLVESHLQNKLPAVQTPSATVKLLVGGGTCTTQYQVWWIHT